MWSLRYRKYKDKQLLDYIAEKYHRKEREENIKKMLEDAEERFHSRRGKLGK